MGDADGAVASEEELGVTGPVALESGTVAVVFPAVELDDEASGGPEYVDLVVEDVDVGHAWRDLVDVAEPLEAILQRRPGSGRCSGLGEQPADWAEGAASVAAFAHARDGVQLQQAEAVSLFPGTFQPLSSFNFGEVEERAGDGGHRDAVAFPAILRVQPPSVEANAALSRAATLRGDVASRLRSLQSPQRCRARMAQQRALATCEYGGKPEAIPVQPHVADRVDAPMQDDEASGLDPRVDCPSSQAKLSQLPPRDHPVLPIGQLRQVFFST